MGLAHGFLDEGGGEGGISPDEVRNISMLASTSLFTSYFHHLQILVIISTLLLCLHTLVALPIFPGVIGKTMMMK
jgi:hypothetical protein